MSELLPNLPDLVNRLPEGSFARKLAEACLEAIAAAHRRQERTEPGQYGLREPDPRALPSRR